MFIVRKFDKFVIALKEKTSTCDHERNGSESSHIIGVTSLPFHSNGSSNRSIYIEGG